VTKDGIKPDMIKVKAIQEWKHGRHEPMSRKSKVRTESGGTWHHPRAIETWLNKGKPSRSGNRGNLVEALRSNLVVSK
jgi:hypothetical protein